MLSFILNLPYTIIGIILGLLSQPTNLSFTSNPISIVLKVRKLWWAIGYMRGARAVTIGHVVILGKNIKINDLDHELIHVKQYRRLPIIFPWLYYIELIRKGYKENKYELEAYSKTAIK
jgi:hypothetical protein